jgi:hypothetical protein
MTRNEIETALDAGRLKILMNTGNYWHVRRNGKTQTWKTRPTHFRIPIKFGFKNYGEINHDNMKAEPCWRIDE